jgi:phosphate transport system permease protein
MDLSIAMTLVAVLGLLAYTVGQRRALASVAGQRSTLHSLPSYYGWYAALWCALPGLLLAVLWLIAAPTLLDEVSLSGLEDLAGAEALLGEDGSRRALFLNEVRNAAEGGIVTNPDDPMLIAAADRYRGAASTAGRIALGLAGAVSIAGGLLALRRIRPDLAARVRVEAVLRAALLVCSTVAILVTLGIVLSLVFETIRFFQRVPVHEFLFGIHWSPQTALRADQVASSGSFGAIPIFAGTLLITAIAMVVAVPIGLLSAISMSFYLPASARAVVKPLLEILAGIPTVVYGFFAALIVAPVIREAGGELGLDVASESALAAGLVMGIMIVPFISSLSDDAITAVPQSLSDGSLALGATRSETIRQVILPAALPGIAGAFLLAISRAIGETMIVVMAAGLAANLTANPFQAVTTVTVQIVTLLTGDQEFDSAKTLSAFALGLVLFIVTLGLNVLALQIVRRYREAYE